MVEMRNNIFSNFHTKLDDFLALTPLALTFGLDWLGMKSLHNTKQK
jgi:hypothetical protein